MIPIREVLVPSDLSAESEQALEHASALAHGLGAHLTLFHAVPLPDHAYPHWAFGHGHDAWVEAQEIARECLERDVADLDPQPSSAPRIVVERATSVPRALLSFIRNIQPDLTVMATHGRDRLAHVLLGSVTETVFKNAFRPVLCLRQPEHGTSLPYRLILVPTDLSPASRLAFPLAALLARTFGARVIALQVQPAPTLATVVGAPPGRDAEIPTEAALWKLVKPDFEDLDLEARVQKGSVWHSIVTTARVEKADLVVMATRGHDSLGDKILGSNTERVVRHAPCPVLVA
jgi:nucleotide-binding universal stress UspA family protein